MTSAQAMMKDRSVKRSFASIVAGALMTLILAASGCHQPLQVNAPLVAPYEQIWAIAPLVNESGASVVDSLAVTDLLREEAEKIHGVDAIPVQRTLEAMRAMDLGRIDSPAQARTLARLVGADAILVGVITAYDPYQPPKLGLTLQIYPAENVTDVSSLDLRRLEAAATDPLEPSDPPRDPAFSGISQVVDAADNGVRIDLENFARGRTDPDTAFHWERFLVVMDLYTQYVCHRLLADLLFQERLRVLRSRTMTTRSRSPAT